MRRWHERCTKAGAAGSPVTAVGAAMTVPLQNPYWALIKAHWVVVIFIVFLVIGSAGLSRSRRRRARGAWNMGPRFSRRPRRERRSVAVRGPGPMLPVVDVRDIAFRAATLPPSRWSLELLRTLEWKRFERLCVRYFQIKGYLANTTRVGADGRIDILLYRKRAATDKVFGVVQCKAWHRNRVGVKPVRELYGVQRSAEAPLAVFITASEFTEEAIAFARSNRLELITGMRFLALLEGLPEEVSVQLLNEVTRGDYTTPTCPKCDIKMVRRTVRRGPYSGEPFWGCPNYSSFPRCRQTFRIGR